MITLGRTPLGQVGILGRRVRSAGAAQAFQATISLLSGARLSRCSWPSACILADLFFFRKVCFRQYPDAHRGSPYIDSLFPGSLSSGALIVPLMPSACVHSFHQFPFPGDTN